MSGLDASSSLYYFLSTIAQTFAAFTAFGYIASQQRITALGVKIDRLKDLTIQMITPDVIRQHRMAVQSPEEIRNLGLRETGNALSFAQRLDECLNSLESVSKDTMGLVYLGGGFSIAAILGIPFIPMAKESNCAVEGIFIVFGVLSIGAGVLIAMFTRSTLRVSARADL